VTDVTTSDGVRLYAFGIARAHVVGLSMGGFCALQLGIRYPDRVSSLLVASAGSGANSLVNKYHAVAD
jgi:pimeloyl-ACP methyl ester carboxylesterase